LSEDIVAKIPAEGAGVLRKAKNRKNCCKANFIGDLPK
jgi:hypothetical protein